MARFLKETVIIFIAIIQPLKTHELHLFKDSNKME